jgi:hypothetical protein
MYIFRSRCLFLLYLSSLLSRGSSIHTMLSHLLPLLAISGVVASPLRPRQDASASVSSAISEATSVTSQLASVASAPSTVTGSVPPASASASSIGNATAAAPSVTMYPDTSNGEPIVVNGAKGVLPGVDSYLGVPFAAPRKSKQISENALISSCWRSTTLPSSVTYIQLHHQRSHSTSIMSPIDLCVVW